jgi:hypothetical protein
VFRQKWQELMYQSGYDLFCARMAQQEEAVVAEDWTPAKAPSTLRLVLHVPAMYLRPFMQRAICSVLDHDLVDMGYGGPDSGTIDIRCRRCGYSAGYAVLY